VPKYDRANGRTRPHDAANTAVDPEIIAYPISAFCLLAGVGRQLVYDEINAGRLVAKKIGRRTLILRADAERWLAAAPAIRPAAERDPKPN
jgi:hypothetical protein